MPSVGSKWKFYSIYIDKYTGVLGMAERVPKAKPLPEWIWALVGVDMETADQTFEELRSENLVVLGWSPGFNIGAAWVRVPRSLHELSQEAREHSRKLSRGKVSKTTTGGSLIEDRISLDRQ